jgi:hypothetical protein
MGLRHGLHLAVLCCAVRCPCGVNRPFADLTSVSSGFFTVEAWVRPGRLSEPGVVWTAGTCGLAVLPTGHLLFWANKSPSSGTGGAPPLLSKVGVHSLWSSVWGGKKGAGQVRCWWLVLGFGGALPCAKVECVAGCWLCPHSLASGTPQAKPPTAVCSC